MSNSIKSLLSTLACFVLTTGCAPLPPQGITRTGPPDISTQAITTETIAYKLSVNDELEVRLGDRADLIQTVRVQPDGMISLTNLPNMLVAGRTVEQVQMALRQSISRFTENTNGNMRPRYLLNAGDEIELRFTYYPSINQVMRIPPDGQISLPYIKTIVAEGITPEQLEQDLQKRYRDYLKKPDLNLVVRSFSSYRVQVGDDMLPASVRASSAKVSLRSFSVPQIFVSGEVAKPGVLSFRSGMTLLQAIIEAGGNRPTAEMRSVVVLRRTAEGDGLMIRRDLLADMKSGLKNDIALLPSDVVLVPKTQVATIAEALDQYIYQLIAPLRNSSFGFVYNLTPDTTVQVK